MRHNYLDKIHLCALGCGCMATVRGGRLGCPSHEPLLSEEEREAVYAAWMRDNFDDVVGPIIQKHMEATYAAGAHAKSPGTS